MLQGALGRDPCACARKASHAACKKDRLRSRPTVGRPWSRLTGGLASIVAHRTRVSREYVGKYVLGLPLLCCSWPVGGWGLSPRPRIEDGRSSQQRPARERESALTQSEEGRPRLRIAGGGGGRAIVEAEDGGS